jgi:hypothetical protein
MSADVVSMDEFRRRRFAPPPSATPILSRYTRDRLKALQLEQQFGSDAVAAWWRETQRRFFAGGMAGAFIVSGLAVLALWGLMYLVDAFAWGALS